MTRRVLVGDEPTSATLRAAVEVLGSGRIVAYPTDTLYGLAVDPRQDAAVDRLCRVKGRARVAGVPLIAADLRQVESCLGPCRRSGADWPGVSGLGHSPSSLNRKRRSSRACTPSTASLAVRVPRCALRTPACRLEWPSHHRPRARTEAG